MTDLQFERMMMLLHRIDEHIMQLINKTQGTITYSYVQDYGNNTCVHEWHDFYDKRRCIKCGAMTEVTTNVMPGV